MRLAKLLSQPVELYKNMVAAACWTLAGHLQAALHQSLVLGGCHQLHPSGVHPLHSCPRCLFLQPAKSYTVGTNWVCLPLVSPSVLLAPGASFLYALERQSSPGLHTSNALQRQSSRGLHTGLALVAGALREFSFGALSRHKLKETSVSPLCSCQQPPQQPIRTACSVGGLPAAASILHVSLCPGSPPAACLSATSQMPR